jgi:hypothetical protein
MRRRFHEAYGERKLIKACQKELMESRGLQMGHSWLLRVGITFLQEEVL